MQPYFIFFYFIFFLCAGCSYFIPEPACPPPLSARPSITSSYCCDAQTIIPVIPEGSQELALVDLVDVALQNSPKTRAAWFQAKSAAGDVGIARGAYLPPITFLGQYMNARQLFGVAGLVGATQQWTFGPTLSTSYLLFDFGGRNSTLQFALAALNSLDWSYNWEIQTVMITVIQNYYGYANAAAIMKANEATVQDNLTTVEAAVALRKAGVKSLADELQAKTSLVQSQISLEQAIGTFNVARATLIQSLGLPPDTPLCVVDLPKRLAVEGVCEDATVMLDAAKNNRADLMALRANVLKNRAAIYAARSNFLPNVNTQIAGGKQWINGLGPANVWSLALNFNYTIFNSFIDANTLSKAQAAFHQAQAALDDQELEAFLAVLTDYYQLIADTEILKYSEDYLTIAKKNRVVAFANYQAGINTIIDLMTANNALNTARQQWANAKTNWLTSVANLAYDMGVIQIGDIRPDQKVNPGLLERWLEKECEEEDSNDVEENNCCSNPNPCCGVQ